MRTPTRLQRVLALLSCCALLGCSDDTPESTTGDADTTTVTDTTTVSDTTGSSDTATSTDTTTSTDTATDVITQPGAACEPSPDGGSAAVSAPELMVTLSDRWHEAWQASPAVADLDGDGVQEIIVARGGLVNIWHLDGERVGQLDTGEGRIWASPVVADLLPGRAGLEVAVAARDGVFLYTADGALAPGFPARWRDELRALATGDLDGDGALELVVVTTSRLEANGQRDLIMAFEADGATYAGFPPNTTGTSGCDDRCYITGGYDQTLALGDLDGEGGLDIVAGQDNAYMSWHHGDGRVFAANAMFEHPTRVPGIRFLHDLSLAQQGWANDEDTANQAHFTNSAPAVADIDGDGANEILVVGSVQNAAQTDRLRGVALWAIAPDGTRRPGFEAPVHRPDDLAGLWDFEGTNVVGATNQVSVADIDASRPGLEMVFAGFDGAIHAVDAAGSVMWSTPFTTREDTLTGGVLIVDLSGDGVPEIVFNSYSTAEGEGALFIVSAAGQELHRVALPERGAMPVPTAADVDGDGDLELVVSLKDGVDRERQVLVYTIPGSGTACMPWPTGRANLWRTGSP